ncbi:hypothetical protein HanHA300_Chr15g0566161 [Helianthus annuus]|nr:hypothetical protein HanHA300_Chr15g0566161 [Helianthus annuus]KAJ0473194.1 hypothetical protein HanHA89_Chr15g0615541 [Helianthus annuus]KAJ0652597.1 hypothetical protein HanOQP8_Chr15g0573911 [Helianthus annuus]
MSGPAAAVSPSANFSCMWGWAADRCQCPDRQLAFFVTEVKVAVPLMGQQDAVLGRIAMRGNRGGYRIPCGDEIHKVSLLILRLGPHTGSARVWTTAGASLSVGATKMGARFGTIPLQHPNQKASITRLQMYYWSGVHMTYSSDMIR